MGDLTRMVCATSRAGTARDAKHREAQGGRGWKHPVASRPAKSRPRLRGFGKRAPDSQCERAASVQPIARATVACLHATCLRIHRRASPKGTHWPVPVSTPSPGAEREAASSQFAPKGPIGLPRLGWAEHGVAPATPGQAAKKYLTISSAYAKHNGTIPSLSRPHPGCRVARCWAVVIPDRLLSALATSQGARQIAAEMTACLARQMLV
jgi:hypothetical protein